MTIKCERGFQIRFHSFIETRADTDVTSHVEGRVCIPGTQGGPMKRRSALALAAGLIAVPEMLSGQTLPQLTVAGVPEESITPALWALKMGMFRRAGLEVTVQSQSSGSAIAAGVAGGTYGIGKSSLVSLINAKSRGLPFVFVVGGGLYDAKNPNTAVVVKLDSPLKTAADLNGKTLGVSALNGIYTLSTREWIDTHGGDSSTLKELEFPTAVVAEALLAGRIDAGALADPELQDALESGKVRILVRNYSAIAPLFMYSGWFCTTDFLAKNRPIVDAFARAMREASVYVNAHPSEAVPVLAKFAGYEPARIARMHHSTYATSLDPKLIQPVIDLCARYKTIPARFDARTMIAPGMG
ncbi:MAG TPA: ABC transporter substrate-binding protein [Candidatus Lustribacter sp.]